jgi:uncharacterized membrane protein
VDQSKPVDVQRLALTVEAMEQRLTALEVLAGVKPAPVEPAPEPKPAPPGVTNPEPAPAPPVEPKPEPPVVITPEPKPEPPPEPAPEPPPVVTTPAPSPQPPIEPAPAPTPGPTRWEGWEVILSTQGALYAGLLLLLIGVASLVAWGYQYMGPAFKIGAGLTLAVSMLGGGEALARWRPKMKWYGMGLIGGGYALGYFLLYAMQNIASVKILDNVLVDSTLLLGWAGLGIAHSLVRKSEEIALLSTLLAFVTISLSPLGFFSVGASAILAVALAAVVVRMDWLKVYALGAVGSYATYLIFTQPQIQSVQGDSMAGFWLSGGFLGVFWLVYNAVAFLLKPAAEDAPERRQTILGVMVLNAAGFVLPSLYSMGTFLPEWRWLFLAAVGVSYFGMSRLASFRGLREVSTMSLLLGLLQVTAALPLKLDQQAVAVVWVLEVALLVYTGLRFQSLPMRGFAVALAAVCCLRMLMLDLYDPHTAGLLGVSFDWRWLLGATAVTSFGLSAWAYRSRKFEAVQNVVEKACGYGFFLVLAAGSAWFVPSYVAPVGLKALFWSIEALALVALGIRLKDGLAQELASLSFLTAGVSLASNYAVVSTPVTCVVIGIFYLASFAFKWAAGTMDTAERRTRHHVYVLASVVLTMLLTGLNGYTDPNGLALRWSIECGLIVLLGFQLKDGAIRRLGAIGFAPVAVSLLSGMDTWTWAGILPVLGILAALHGRYRLGCPADDKTTSSFLDQLGEALGKDENEYLKRIYFVLSSLLLAAACGVLVEPARLPLVWTCQFAVTVGAGFVLRERYLRLLGTAGFLAVGIALACTTAHWTWVSMIPIVTVLMALHAWYRMGCPEDSAEETELDKQLSILLGDGEANILRVAYAVAGSLVLTASFGVLLDAKWLALAWACQSFASIALGFTVKDVSYRQLGTAGMVLAGFAMATTLTLWTWGTVLPVVAILFALYYAYLSLARKAQTGNANWLANLLPGDTPEKVAESLRKMYGIAAVVLLTACFAQLLDSRILAVAWSLEGFALVALGFLVGDKLFNKAGLTVLSVLTLKLLFVDLSGAETIQRILSFIAAGVAWLAVAFVNGWLLKKLDKPASDESASQAARNNQP